MAFGYASWTAETAPCIICGRPCKDPKYMIHEHEGGGTAVAEEEAAKLDGAGDMGLQPIGADCLDEHPELRPYVQVQGTASKPRKAAKKVVSVDWTIYADLYRQVFGEGATDQEIKKDIKNRQELLGYTK
jgi:hypothetical protein